MLAKVSILPMISMALIAYSLLPADCTQN